MRAWHPHLAACTLPTLAAKAPPLQVVVVPIYLSPEGSASGGNGGGAAGASRPAGPALEQALFHSGGGEHGLRGLLGCEPRDAAVLMSGVPGELAAAITRRLTQAGLPGERVMFCEYL